MKASFNLIAEPWIPCLRLNGEYVELGLRDTLVNAHELREVFDNSPLVTAALYRLLLAVLHRNFGPPNLKTWSRLYKKGRFKQSTLDEYWKSWKSRFDLFDERYPFYQSRHEEVINAKVHPISKLAQEFASGNNDTLFDHSINDFPPCWTYDVAARYVVATQQFAIGGGISKPFNLNHAPLVRGAFVLLRGSTLFQTLMFNFNVYNDEEPPHLSSTERDCPSWENDDWRAEKRPPYGYLDLLTNQSRRLLLIPSEKGGVQEIYLVQGVAFDRDSYLEPMMTYRSKDPKKGFLPYRLKENHALWRDSSSLINQLTESVRPAVAVNQFSAAMELYDELENETLSIDVLGLKTDDNQAAKINLWRHERMPLPVAYLKNDDLVADLETALSNAEDTGNTLYMTTRTLASKLLAPFNDNQRKPDKNQVSNMARNFSAMPCFWSSLEESFYVLYRALPGDPETALDRWCDVLRVTAHNSLEQTIDGLDGSARSLQAAAEAQCQLNIKLSKILPRKEVLANV